MKKILGLAIMTLIAVGCGDRPYHERSKKMVYSGKHELRKMSTVSHEKNSLSGGFFLFMGSISGETKNEVKVYFAWKMNTGEYSVNNIDLTKIRFKFENVETPYVEFGQSAYSARDWAIDTQHDMDYWIYYMTITCREDDWPKDIKLPMNGAS